MGYTVVGTASSGQEAVEIAGETHPDLVLMDIVLKGDMYGIEAAQQIINLYNIPIIYITAYADEKTLERAMVTEPYGYLLKPFKETELKANIKMALYKHRTESRRKESIEKRLMDDYYQFIFKSMKGSVDESKAKNMLFRALEKILKKK